MKNMKNFKTLEQICVVLLDKKIRFKYDPSFVEVGHGEIIEPFSASYHSVSKRVVIMNDSFEEIPHLEMINILLKKY